MRPRKTVPRIRLPNTRQVNWKKLGLITGGSLLALLMLVQIFYPGDRLLPLVRIDGRSVAGQKKQDVIVMLNKAYDAHTLAIYMGSGKKPVVSPKLSTIDISVDNTKRVDALKYPWYLRIIPTSLVWAGRSVAAPPAPTFGKDFDHYITEHLMPDCRQAPQNATLKLDHGKLVVVPAANGGVCEQKDVLTSIKKVKPTLERADVIRVTRKEQVPTVSDSAARKKADELNSKLGGGVTLDVNGTEQTIAANDVFGWLDFGANDADVTAVVNADRAGAWLAQNIGGKVAIKPGTSHVTTLDFTELSRTDAPSGRALDVGATVATLQQVVDGSDSSARAVTKVVSPIVQYTRTYSPSDAGLSALMANYAHDHPGAFGISMIELDGKKRRAEYNGDKQFVTASTYKLFVAYSLMKQIDSGARDWDSNATCFNKMISQSDNACAESFLNSLGLKTVTNDIQAIGLSNSTFMKSGGPYTTANDLTLLLGMIASGQNFSGTNQQRLISAMKANVYRQGIPAGAQGTVADKVGFLGGLFHDAAIVYSPSGTYVLAIMTDGSSWATIADITKQIDALRVQ